MPDVLYMYDDIVCLMYVPPPLLGPVTRPECQAQFRPRLGPSPSFTGMSIKLKVAKGLVVDPVDPDSASVEGDPTDSPAQSARARTHSGLQPPTACAGARRWAVIAVRREGR